MDNIILMTSSIEVMLVAVVALVCQGAVAVFTIKRLVRGVLDGYTILGVLLVTMLTIELVFVAMVLNNSIIV